MSISKERFEAVKQLQVEEIEMLSTDIGFFKDAYHRFTANKGAVIGFFAIVIILFFALSYLFFGTREINITKRYINTIKTLIVLSIAWW